MPIQLNTLFFGCKKTGDKNGPFVKWSVAWGHFTPVSSVDRASFFLYRSLYSYSHSQLFFFFSQFEWCFIKTDITCTYVKILHRTSSVAQPGANTDVTYLPGLICPKLDLFSTVSIVSPTVSTEVLFLLTKWFLLWTTSKPKTICEQTICVITRNHSKAVPQASWSWGLSVREEN